jgi:hypothetical protein
LRDGRGAKGVGLDNVGTGCEVLGMNFLNEAGLGEAQELVVTLDLNADL